MKGRLSQKGRVAILNVAHLIANCRLSYAGTFALATGGHGNAGVLTADPEFAALENMLKVAWLGKE